ncbi:TatD family hydrolase [Peloplasma aerotolerans]|uniref:TatD family hydrolase n=1 Tax=Peloplasma aerotolerans TaxID=3044389 RepID=A0AAW6UAQ2_9MOLU|nr:TatD family hydrolase [Mariniplasma sp. M4Ah]MDI6453507.1 TatD family hydrolase [Mariniplasma sp. M4Ah]
MIVDTHAHLNTEEYVHDIDEVLEEAQIHGVSKVIVIGMDEASNQRAIELAKTHKMLFATVGVHPAYVDTTTTNHLEALLEEEKVVAIGECGLDLHWKQDNIKKQKEIFIQQIELAVKTKLPLIIHTRDSFEETYQCLLPYKGQVTGVFHCFSSNLEDAKRAIDLGFYIGIDGPITFKKAYDLVDVVKNTDLSYILVETDSPYLSPMPYRGKRNEPAYTKHVVKKIAELKKMTYREVSNQTTSNAHKLFNLGGLET